MTTQPCPICRKPVHWEQVATRPFCSERCRLRDLGAWSGEQYRVPEDPDTERGEAWSEPDGEQ